MFISILLIIAAYLLGAISTAIIACRLLGATDPRTVGSGNPGATNVLRAGGRRAAGITFCGDVIKGLAPVVAARGLGLDDSVIGAVALAAFCGHVFPVYYGFKGGKGVATGLGALCGVHALVGISAFATWLLVASTTRFSSVAALATSLMAPVYMLIMTGSAWFSWATVIMAAIIIWRHRSNISQLLEGSEEKIGSSG
ncbi:MAG: glycerol-3-phosphate 1-O-acyltransferase PlsY [Gammaproteobacteria bacterium]|nr:glycerol-3-phosphate 1-O-acyltransferase PlsY [Gammaproteobacteria bacterium]